MDDNLSKYLSIAIRVFALVAGFLVVAVAAMFLLRYLAAAYDSLPWAVTIFMAFMLMVPAAIFVTAHVTFLFRTKAHSSIVARGVSYFFLVLLLLAWIAVLGVDYFKFFTGFSIDIKHYYSFNVFFLVLNGAIIFMLAIIQALTVDKEKHWLEKYQPGQTQKNPPV